MGVHLAVARQSFRRQSTYRAATAAGIFTNTVFGIVLASVIAAAFRERPDINGLSVNEAVTMTFFAQAMLLVVGAFGWREIADRVKTGQIAVDLQRPVDVSSYWGSVFIGQSAYSLVARGIPPFAIGAVFFDLVIPRHLGRWLETLVVIAGAAIVASRWWFLISLGSFWLGGDTRGIIQLGATLQLLASGSIIPLQFFSGWFGTVLRWSPFATMSQLPSEVWLGRQSGLGVLGAQLAWAAVIHVVGLAGWRVCARKLVIDGG